MLWTAFDCLSARDAIMGNETVLERVIKINIAIKSSQSAVSCARYANEKIMKKNRLW